MGNIEELRGALNKIPKFLRKIFIKESNMKMIGGN